MAVMRAQRQQGRGLLAYGSDEDIDPADHPPTATVSHSHTSASYLLCRSVSIRAQ